MSIPLTSRYAAGHVYLSTESPRNKDGVDVPVVLRRPSQFRPNVDSVYRWVSGDRWDTVAEKLGLPKADWWKLLDANPHIEFPTSMRPGDPVAGPLVSKRVI